ncbi:ABC transporter permease [Caminicella sporogenes]|uniref:ABC transporter permease n=1 Tax=Caminicella sporogenes TaxID=166485 RepID=UPI0025405A23|nr:ABC transporter permease [Caminicella sporogenes]WIF93965.1 ABC transporter permease [Caminicella sporogenes]
MNIIESIKVALNAIWVNKMRSLLTMLGIIIGISSVIAVVALGQGSKEMIKKEFENFGVNRAYLGINWNENITDRDIFTHEDIEVLKRAFKKDIDALSPLFDNNGEVAIERKNERIYIKGVNEEYNRIERKEIIDGRFLVSSDIKGNREVAVINDEMALKLFGRRHVIGEKILVKTSSRNISLVIVGVYKEKKSMFAGFGREMPRDIYVPISTVEKMFGVGNRVYGIEINFKSGINTKETLDKMIKLIERRHGNTQKNKYRSFSAESELKSVNKVTGIMTAVVGAIAAISLLVGGIGVMNIMLVSVTERTREIGIRKAIGARHKDILFQFLVEAVIISGIGGIIGTVLGIGLSFVIASFIKLKPTISIMTIIIAWMFSAGVGIFFGIYPANKAAKLDPIEALRYE